MLQPKQDTVFDITSMPAIGDAMFSIQYKASQTSFIEEVPIMAVAKKSKSPKVSISKPIYKSKTFWLNILGIAASVAEVLPPEYAVPVLAIANIGIKLIPTIPVKLNFE
jgi:hypothetical protein